MTADCDAVREALRAYIDHSIPTHSAVCAGQADEAECICGAAEIYERALEACEEVI